MYEQKLTFSTDTLVKSGLTPRQRQVLWFRAQDYSTKWIAENLNISPYTVKGHIVQAVQIMVSENKMPEELQGSYGCVGSGDLASVIACQLGLIPPCPLSAQEYHSFVRTYLNYTHL